ncbi:hypothetical protein V5305_26550, partial [Escherichia coli]|uniref:hypothetical protein n=1 Tax=Escherichia coli TaxID=562 RepID=UPI002FD6925E
LDNPGATWTFRKKCRRGEFVVFGFPVLLVAMTGENSSTTNAYILFTAFVIFLAFYAFNAFTGFKGGR